MKIVIFTVNDSEYIPNLLDPILSERSQDIKYVFISKTLFSFKKFNRNFKFFLLNLYPFCISKRDLFLFFIKKLKFTFDKVFRSNPKYDLKKFLYSKGIKFNYVEKINEEQFLKKIRKIEPDIILFAVFDKIAKKELIEIPKIGTFNLHLGPLPSYKGGLSAFWLLRFKEKYAGASIHKVTEKIDEGDLIDETKFLIKTNSMCELMKENINIASIMLPSIISKINSEKYKIIDTSKRKSNYYLFPTFNDFRHFYRNGSKLI